MFHRNSTLNHRLENWIYADATARLAATGFVAGDVGKIAFQSDNKSYWRLDDDSPITWTAIFTEANAAKIEAYTYANEAAREAATGFVAGDVGKIAFQSDTSTYWRLTDDSPVTWLQVGETGVLVSFTYADTAAREGATGLEPDDVGKVAFQTDDSSYWRLTDDSPVTWGQIASSGVSLPAGGTVDQILVKQSSDPGDAAWEDDPSPSVRPGTIWRYNNASTTDADPGAGYFKVDNADGTAATKFMFDTSNYPAQSWGTFLIKQVVGNVIYVYPPGAQTNQSPGIFRVTVTPVDNTGWVTIGIDYIGGYFYNFAALALNDQVSFDFSGPISA